MNDIVNLVTDSRDSVVLAVVNILESTHGYLGPVPSATSGKEPISHWVVVTGMSDTHVRIINPLNNRVEYYTSQQFRDARSSLNIAVLTRSELDAHALWCELKTSDTDDSSCS